MSTEGLLDEFVTAIESRLDAILPTESGHSQALVDGMRYAVLNGGKRLRGSLVCAATHTLSDSYENALDCACALECMHAYSLVHDDLPVMDDADTRRGQPSCHRVFGPAMATLIGDALQPFSFNVILDCEDIPREKRLEIAKVVSRAAGWHGMVGGQAWDIRLTKYSELRLEELRRLHAAKTGEFFVAAVDIGRIIGEENQDDQLAVGMRRFGTYLGEAFQVVDDVIDCSQPSDVTGKPIGQDERLGKQTFPVLLGIDQATAYAHELLGKALDELKQLGLTDSVLADVAKRCVERIN
ncbi:MAG: polyprenyl synthetase family protein [Gammaproteobacteria bacterium]|nr:polyprenyl synthetase family protein [Gammaproteobacteria bacterium]